MAALVIVFLGLSAAASVADAAPPSAKKTTALERAQLEYEANRFGSAAKLLSESLHTDPQGSNSGARYLLLGQAQAKQKLPDDALRTFTTLASRYTDTEWAARAIAEKVAIYQGARPNSSEVEKLRKVLLERYPESPTTAEIWINVADGLFADDKLNEAVGIYRQFEKSLTPESAKRFGLAKVIVEADAEPSKIYAAAEDALKNNRITLAKTLLARLIKGGGSTAKTNEYRLKYAWCLYLEGGEDNLKESEKIWSSIAMEEPLGESGSASRWHLIQLHAGPKREWEKAVDLCAALAKDMPKDSFRHEQALFTRAWLLRTHKQWAKAKLAFEELVREYPSKATHEPIMQYIGEIEENLQNPKKSTGK